MWKRIVECILQSGFVFKYRNVRILNARGIAMINVIIVGAITSVTTLLITSVIIQQHRQQDEISFRSNVLGIRSAIMSAIVSDNSWLTTVDKNNFIKCASEAEPYCSPTAKQRRLVDIYSASGEKVFGSINPTNGYRFDGTHCSDFSPSGNDSCPLRANIYWRAICKNSACSDQEDFLSIEFDFKPKSASKNYPLNLVNYNVVEQSRYRLGGNDSPVMICARRGMIFIGEGNSFNGHSSDSEGCIPYVAFRGETGPQGPMGMTGPIGATGRQGKAGRDAVCPICPICPSTSEP